MIWSLLGLFRGDLEPRLMMIVLAQLAGVVFVILFCLSAHEFAHAWMAKKLGDDTAFLRGRLTLDPMKHLDLFGTLLLLIAGVGYAKPVPVNPGKFTNLKFEKKRIKKGNAMVAAAGPATNLIIAAIFYLLRTVILFSLLSLGENDIVTVLFIFCGTVASYNLWLALFNLLPIPPLDGSRILDLFLPLRASIWLDQNEQYFRYGLFAVLILLRFVPRFFS